MSARSSDIPARVARELSLPLSGVKGALELFDEGATLPFVARYRKEATGGLDDLQLRDVRDRAAYLTELEKRRAAILGSLEERDLLTPPLRAGILAADTRQELEDLYLPWRPRRRTRATMAIERGLEPLARQLRDGGQDDARIRRSAERFVDLRREVPDVEAALRGARDILAQEVAEDPALRRSVRRLVRAEGFVASSLARGKADHPGAARFRDYHDHREPLRSIPSHRMLAIRRGEAEGVLSWTIEGPADRILRQVERTVAEGRAAREQLREVARDATTRLLMPSISKEIAAELKERADAEAIRVFGENLEQLLLQPPAGRLSVLGLDPGFRSGVKIAMVSDTGAVLATSTLHLHREEAFRRGLLDLVERHAPELIAIGNGTGSRETEAAVRRALEEGRGSRGTGGPGSSLPAIVTVSEAGASVYSASEVARQELPEMDVSLRGAVSIARRVQDPLAELVKIDPRSIGVGQYQHDVDQTGLRLRLDETVERCVNRVGVEVNTASPALLAHVAGIGPALARNIVAFRDARGGIGTRRELLEVPRLGARAFEQAAGFLRVRESGNPLDGSAVHPERYALVETMARDAGLSVRELVGNEAALERLEANLETYVSAEIGLPTLRDILDELRRPGRDPRDAFELPSFRDDVREPSDLSPGMRLQGVVTNVVAFGAFVDIGVHQDGLVHVSQLADRYVKDPTEVVRVGQRVEVRVLEVDLERNRIALTMKSARR